MKQIQITLNVNDEFEHANWDEFQHIFQLLVNKGALTGIRGGHTKLHFDGKGDFVGVELVYWPWKKR